MTKRDYTQEFKEQILRECQEVGNVAVVARRHNISPNTIHTWRSKARKTGSTKPLPADEAKRIKELQASGLNKCIMLASFSTLSSTYYSHRARQGETTLPGCDDGSKPLKSRAGRRIRGYSYTRTGQKVSDEQIKEFIMEEISGDGYPYGYRKLTTSMQEDYQLNNIHHRCLRPLHCRLPHRPSCSGSRCPDSP